MATLPDILVAQANNFNALERSLPGGPILSGIMTAIGRGAPAIQLPGGAGGGPAGLFPSLVTLAPFNPPAPGSAAIRGAGLRRSGISS